MKLRWMTRSPSTGPSPALGTAGIEAPLGGARVRRRRAREPGRGTPVQPVLAGVCAVLVLTALLSALGSLIVWSVVEALLALVH